MGFAGSCNMCVCAIGSATKGSRAWQAKIRRSSPHVASQPAIPGPSSRSSAGFFAPVRRRIAACCQEDPGAILAYENIFYDMRSLLGAEDAILNRIQRPQRLPFLRVDLEAMIREVAYAGGPFMLEPALRYYHQKFHPRRVAGKPDPTPRLTQKFADKVELHIWGLDPASAGGCSCSTTCCGASTAHRSPRLRTWSARCNHWKATRSRACPPRLRHSLHPATAPDRASTRQALRCPPMATNTRHRRR